MEDRPKTGKPHRWKKGELVPGAKPLDMSPEAVAARVKKGLETKARKKERGEKWSVGLAALQRECGSEPLTEKMVKDTLMAFLGLPRETIERIIRDKNEKALYAVIASGLLGDIKRGELKSLLAIIERLFGKVADNIVIQEKAPGQALAEAASDEELLAEIGKYAVGDMPSGNVFADKTLKKW